MKEWTNSLKSFNHFKLNKTFIFWDMPKPNT